MASPLKEERSDARMNFRMKPRIKEAIQRAAALSGVDDSAFAIRAAYEAALATISAHEKTVLQAQDHEAFFRALDSEARPSPPLKEAFDRHAKLLGS